MQSLYLPPFFFLRPIFGIVISMAFSFLAEDSFTLLLILRLAAAALVYFIGFAFFLAASSF
jgi:hypothetical protein